ncbi:2OG-Fe(II) oxygenase family protein [Rhodococcus erythropolis]|uniref:2OG-Fe(II) oxygenase family protein n=1 Tax=Rhodococcus erythropolis TaxID=1833 RepID=UPI0011C029CF|nr:2OG-Fe(II) oxygenase family protein [Rhodococcus erythropolis]
MRRRDATEGLLRNGVIELGSSDHYGEIRELFLDASEALRDPSVAAIFQDWAEQWSCEVGGALHPGLSPRIRNRPPGDRRGHKDAIQTTPGMYWIAQQYGSGGVPVPFLRLMAALEKGQQQAAKVFRSVLPLHFMPTLVTSRIIGYREGAQLGQGWHKDPSIATIIHRGPGDNHLMIKPPNEGGQIVTAPESETASAVMITGSSSGSVLPGTEPLQHAVRPIESGQLRLSITYFLWPAPISWAGMMGMKPMWDEPMAA